MSISEQVKELRSLSDYWKNDYEPRNAMRKAADTIESLSAKLQVVNMEQSKANYSIGDLSELIDKFGNEKIKGITDFEQVQVFNALKYLDMYQKVGTIEKFMELKQNMWQSVEDCSGGWIYCGDGNNLPKDQEWYMTTCVINYSNPSLIEPFSTELFFDGENFDTEEIEDDSYTVCTILAWQHLPEPYHKS